MSTNRAHGIWRLHGLQVSRMRPRPWAVWAYDFVFDACANEQQLKCLTVIEGRCG